MTPSASAMSPLRCAPGPRPAIARRKRLSPGVSRSKRIPRKKFSSRRWHIHCRCSLINNAQADRRRRGTIPCLIAPFLNKIRIAFLVKPVDFLECRSSNSTPTALVGSRSALHRVNFRKRANSREIEQPLCVGFRLSPASPGRMGKPAPSSTIGNSRCCILCPWP